MSGSLEKKWTHTEECRGSRICRILDIVALYVISCYLDTCDHPNCRNTSAAKTKLIHQSVSQSSHQN